MASYLQVENINKAYGNKVLLDNITFNINEGDKIALIAPNGSGKTTLLNILAGIDHSDMGGKITFLRNIHIAYLQQDYIFDPNLTIYEQVFADSKSLKSAIDNYEAAMRLHDNADANERNSKDSQKRLEEAIAEMDRVDGWNCKQIIEQTLTELKITNLERKMSMLSGGEVKRVAIAVALLQKADFYILDEPTNHLDIDIIEYLEDLLKKSRATLFMVTHDRYFLNRVCNTIYELERGKLYIYKGNYEEFLDKRQERIDNRNAETDKARNLLRRELEWIRSTPCARTGKAKYRIDAFYDLKERAEYNFTEAKLNINLSASRLGKKIIHCKGVNFSYPTQHILKDFTYNFQRYEKVGIVGDNGVGKSTFLKLLTSELQPESGTIEQGETIRFGHYRQEGITFNPDDTIFDVVHDIAEHVTMSDGSKISVSSFLNWFMFPPNTHNTKIGKLSGGEKRRLYLLTVLMRNPNFLILDEPTNDLDIMTINVLEEYLQNFNGCLLIVSHDRYFLDKLSQHIFIFLGDGNIKDWYGSCSEYRSYLKDYQAAQRAEENARKKASAEKPVTNKHQDSQKRKLSFKEQQLLKQLEAEVAQLEDEKQQLEAQLSNPGLPFDQIQKASTRIGEVIPRLDTLYDQLLELY